VSLAAIAQQVRAVIHGWAVDGLDLSPERVLWASQPVTPDGASPTPSVEHATIQIIFGPSRTSLYDEVRPPPHWSPRDTLTVDQQRELTLNVQTYGDVHGDRLRSLIDSMGLPTKGSAIGCSQVTTVEVLEAVADEDYLVLVADEAVSYTALAGDTIEDIRDALVLAIDAATILVSVEVVDLGAGRAGFSMTGHSSGFQFAVELGDYLAIELEIPAVDIVVVEDMGTTDVSGLVDSVWWENRMSCDFRLWLQTRVLDEPGFIEQLIGEGRVTGTLTAPYVAVPMDITKEEV